MPFYCVSTIFLRFVFHVEQFYQKKLGEMFPVKHNYCQNWHKRKQILPLKIEFYEEFYPFKDL